MALLSWTPKPDDTIMVVKDGIEYLLVLSAGIVHIYQHDVFIRQIELAPFISGKCQHRRTKFVPADPGLICLRLYGTKQYILLDLDGQVVTGNFDPLVEYIYYGVTPTACITGLKTEDRYAIYYNGQSKRLKEDINGFWVYKHYLYAGYELPTCYVINMYDLRTMKRLMDVVFKHDAGIMMVNGRFLWYNHADKQLKLTE